MFCLDELLMQQHMLWEFINYTVSGGQYLVIDFAAGDLPKVGYFVTACRLLVNCACLWTVPFGRTLWLHR
jgi:hypothetical protein